MSIYSDIKIEINHDQYSSTLYSHTGVDCSWLLHVLGVILSMLKDNTNNLKHMRSGSVTSSPDKLKRVIRGHNLLLHLPNLLNWFSSVLMLESGMRKPQEKRQRHQVPFMLTLCIINDMHSFTTENHFNNLQKQTTITYHEHLKTNPKWQANRFYKHARQDTPHPSQSPIIPLVYWHTHGQNILEHSCIRTQCMRNSISIKNTQHGPQQARPAKSPIWFA